MPSSRHLLSAAVAALLSATTAAQSDPDIAPVVGAPSTNACALPFGHVCYSTVDAAFAAFERARGPYSTGEERMMRKAAFEASASIVSDFNSQIKATSEASAAAVTVADFNAQPDATFTLALNPTSDLTDAEFKARYLGLKISDVPPMVQASPLSPDEAVPASRRLRITQGHRDGAGPHTAADTSAHAKGNGAPVAAVDEGRKLQALTAVDWVAAGKVNPIKDQGQCGSCWSFATIASVETNAAIAGLPLTPLSEQLLVDCNTANSGCNGGDMVQAFSWLIQRGGACASAAYPYKAVQGACTNTCPSMVKLSSYTKPTTTDAGLSAAAVKGAVAVAIQADSSVFRYYSSGVLDSSTCGTNLNHGVTVVGQGTDSASGKAYFKIRNSWGTGWGETGYVRMAYGKNTCGITMYLSQPVIDASFNPSGIAPSATPTRSASASASRSPASPSSTASRSASKAASPSASASRSAAASGTATASGSAAASTSATTTATRSGAPSTSASATASGSAAPSASATVTASASATATRSGSSGASATGTASRSPAASISATATRSGSSGASVTGTASRSPAASVSATATRSGSSGASATQSGTASHSLAASVSATGSASATAPVSHSASASASVAAAAAPGGASGINGSPAADPANGGGSSDGLVPVTPGNGAAQPSSSGSGSRLSAGAIGGIVAGVVAAAALIALAVLAATRSSRMRKAAAPAAAAPPAPPTPAVSPAATGIAV